MNHGPEHHDEPGSPDPHAAPAAHGRTPNPQAAPAAPAAHGRTPNHHAAPSAPAAHGTAPNPHSAPAAPAAHGTPPNSHAAPAAPAPNSHAAPATPAAHGPATTTETATFANEARATWERIKNSGDGWLMSDTDPAEEVSLVKTPFYIIRDWVRGSIGNVLRRGKEVLSPLKNVFTSVKNLIVNPFKPKETPIFHPIKYFSNIPRIATSIASSVKNLLKSPIPTISEGYQDIAQTPIERIDYKVAKIPPKKVTGLISKFNNGIANVLGWPLRTANKVSKWATDWVDDLDEYFGAATQGA